MTINVNIFIVLPIPAFVVNIEQIHSVICFYHHFYSCFAPNVLCITCINLFTWFNRFNYMTFDPFVISLNSFIPAKIIWDISFLFSAICNHFDRVVYQQWRLKDLTSNILSALWTLFFSDHTFTNALMAKRVATNCYSTADDIIHTDWTCQTLNFSHWRICSLFLITNFQF